MVLESGFAEGASRNPTAFAISWGGILVVIRGGAIPAPAQEAHRLFVVVYLAMLAGPSIAGIAVTAITTLWVIVAAPFSATRARMHQNHRA